MWSVLLQPLYHGGMNVWYALDRMLGGLQCWTGCFETDLTDDFLQFLLFSYKMKAVQWVPGLSQGKMWPGRDADPSPPSSAKVKNRVELYLYSPKGLCGL